VIVFDLQAVQSVQHGERGIARFVGELASGLLRLDPCPVDVFAWNDALPYVPRLEPFGRAGRLRSYRELRGRHVDVVHVTSPFESAAAASMTAPVRARRLVATCYDLIPHIFSDVYLPDSSARAGYQARLGLLLAADHVVTDSESAADDLASRLGYPRRRLTSIGAGTAPEFVPSAVPRGERLTSLRQHLADIEPGFVLVPAGPDWRKNLRGTIAAYAGLESELRARHQLVIASRMNDGQRSEIRGIADAHGVGGRVLLTGLVTDAVLVELYQTAELVVFASLYEGFGLPVLEARRCGARVICSDVASLPEVMLEPAALFNPHLVSDMTRVMSAALTDPETMVLLDRAADPGFTWDVAASRVAEVYRRVRPPHRGGARRRLAVVTEAVPETTDAAAGCAGDAVFVAGNFVEHLGSVADVTVFVSDRPAYLERRTALPIGGLRTLNARWAAGEFDHVVYVIGASALVDGPPALLPLVPGHALFAADIALVRDGDPDSTTRLLDAVDMWTCSWFALDAQGADAVAQLAGRRPDVLAASDDGPGPSSARRFVASLDQFGAV
jgi:glycosyltransferase involved in cell wall biosynthesis